MDNCFVLLKNVSYFVVVPECILICREVVICIYFSYVIGMEILQPNMLQSTSWAHNLCFICC